MAALNTKLAVNNQIIALVQAYGPFTGSSPLIKPGNIITGTTFNNQDRANAIKNGVADYPKLYVEMADDSTNSIPAPRTFGMSTTIGGSTLVDHCVPVIENAVLDIVHDSALLANQSVVEAAVRAALFTKGLNMGLRWVRTIRFNGIVRRFEKSPKTGNTLRVISRLRLVVTGSPLLSQLTST